MGSGIGKRAREVVKPALDRLDALEANVRGLAMNQKQILESVNGVVARIQQDLSVMDDIVNAVSEIVGRDKILEVIKKMVEDRATARAEQEKARLAEALAAGELAKSDQPIGLGSIVIGRETTATGEVYGPGWQQFLVAKVKDEALRGVMLGRKVGDVVELPSTNKFEVQEVYEFVAPTEGEKVPQDAAPPAEQSEAGGELAEGAQVPATVPEVDEEADKALEAYMAQAQGGPDQGAAS